MSSHHAALHRPDLRPLPALHDIVLDRPSLHHRVDHRLEQVSLRCVLYELSLRARRWHIHPRAQHAGTGISEGARLEAPGTRDRPGVRTSLTLFDQCTRDILQDYYVNLVRTFSKGTYALPDLSSDSSMGSSSDEESDSDDITMASRPSSPYLDSAVPGILVSRRPSALVDTSSIPQEARRPTIEQNMAFAELRNTHHAADPEWR